LKFNLKIGSTYVRCLRGLIISSTYTKVRPVLKKMCWATTKPGLDTVTNDTDQPLSSLRVFAVSGLFLAFYTTNFIRRRLS